MASSPLLHISCQDDNTNTAYNIPFNYFFPQQVLMELLPCARHCVRHVVICHYWKEMEDNKTKAFSALGRKHTHFGKEMKIFKHPLENLRPWGWAHHPNTSLCRLWRKAVPLNGYRGTSESPKEHTCFPVSSCQHESLQGKSSQYTK